jgi:hypothetical protein
MHGRHTPNACTIQSTPQETPLPSEIELAPRKNLQGGKISQVRNPHVMGSKGSQISENYCIHLCVQKVWPHLIYYH